MASWNDEKMTDIDRICIKESIGELGFEEALTILESTERTFFRG
jgi:hypothetical protein